jgi:dihydrofolate synthase / folylpolyglutamate synthase
MDYNQVVAYLENLGVMPKTAPGLHKISKAVGEKVWFKNLNPEKIITIAGTNGKGTTCAALEALLLDANQKVGLFTSPHLISTTERIRLNGVQISKDLFIQLFDQNKELIEKYHLSHFESLTLMAADLFFTSNLNYVIFEVGLGGSFDATNIFPNKYAVITKIGLDHENILGSTLYEIALNKFGIIKSAAVVIHHALPVEVNLLKEEIKEKTNSTWTQADFYHPIFDQNTKQWVGQSDSDQFETNLIGPRAIENCATAIKIFKTLGFDFVQFKQALLRVNWEGRMQKVSCQSLNFPLYLSGDHNLQGIQSLIEIIEYFDYEQLHLIVGIGQDKSFDQMLKLLCRLPRMNLYLTETPFKGLSLVNYPDQFKKKALIQNRNVFSILKSMKVSESDMVVVTGSLYLVGEVLKKLSK